MQAITTHKNADFDALASLVAAGKLYPEAQLVVPGTLNLNVREFVSLYKDTFQLATQKDIDVAAINMLVVTDTRQKDRIGPFTGVLDTLEEIHLYDHHPDTDEDIVTEHTVCEEVGATTTILLEKIYAANIPLSSFEATLFALGIYEDTGCLTFDTTTPRDVAALARLWEIGVNLRVVNQFLNRPLSDEQRVVLDALLSSTQYHELRGVRVAVAVAACPDYVGGLSLLTHKLMEIEDVDVIFTVVSMAERVYVVGRSRIEQVDLGKILAKLNGKGHRHAASATLKETTLEDVLETLVHALYKEISPVKTARDIMSEPVRSITPDTTVDKARERMLRYGHSGFPVVENGGLLGIISRRDLEKASHHGLGHAPVKGYMSKRPRTVPADTPVREIQQLMIEYNLGRLPVTDEGTIVGIVTRTDVLRNLEGTEKVRCATSCTFPAAGDDLTPLINSRLSKKIQSLLLLVAQKADKENVKVFAVGGFIRDLLLNIKNHDLDLVVEPAAIPFAEELNKMLGGRLTSHEKFGTASIVLPEGIHIDLVTSRQEFYARPAALPEVEQSSLKNDLFRRDFTINTLACSLNSPGFGKLIDLFNGIGDLEKGLIRVLYNLSFVEDPLRVLRAIRFEQRFGFRLEETTLSLMENAAQTRVLEKVSKERLHDELVLALQEEKAPEILIRYFTLNIAPMIFPGIRLSDALQERLFAAREMCYWANRNWPDTEVVPGNLYLAALLLEAPFQEARHICRRLRLPQKQREPILAAVEAVPRLKEKLLANALKPSELYRLFSGQPVETLLLLQADSKQSRIWESTALYWEKLRHIQPHISGHDLRELGFKPGPGFQEVLSHIRAARLNGEVKNREEELAMAKKMLAARERNNA
ncbi:CBS domain-containing protein [Dethiobacter alkaliphilus]|uniref:CBS domain containing protein n=1 Tax=Dethiobacter alkaliphilus AHT 1 TaxID=555088 RepID=C0GDZ3_DETAL|nr:CBS domain-containing protein [Dethiobacter alkaliphilus]EEG78287.1 CBS domain containing protein [Dethiobacter alkaliphilus AHT 1]